MEEERILLGSWLLGYNLDDMGQLDTTDFIHYGQIFRLLKEGNTALEISRKVNLPIVDEVCRVKLPHIIQVVP